MSYAFSCVNLVTHIYLETSLYMSALVIVVMYPQGVIRVKILEAKDLKKADIGFTGKGKSDPYVVIRGQ